jgi:hypothetical protein
MVDEKNINLEMKNNFYVKLILNKFLCCLQSDLILNNFINFVS